MEAIRAFAGMRGAVTATFSCLYPHDIHVTFADMPSVGRGLTAAARGKDDFVQGPYADDVAIAPEALSARGKTTWTDHFRQVSAVRGIGLPPAGVLDYKAAIPNRRRYLTA